MPSRPRLFPAALVALALAAAVPCASAVTLGTFDLDAGGPVPDPGSTSFTFSVAGLDGLVSDVNVRIAIAHPLNEDLDVSLLSPDGTTVVLFQDVGGVSDDFQDTLLDDSALTSITLGSGPFVGTFRPQGSLSDFNGENPNGVWTLLVADDFSLDGGTVYAPGENIPWSNGIGTQLIVTTRTPTGNAIPEPASAALGALALCALSAATRRRR